MAPHGALRPPVVEQPRQADPVAQAIHAAEADMPSGPAATAPAEPEFRPQSRIFQAPAPEAFERAPAPRPAMPQAPAAAAHAVQPQAYQQPQHHAEQAREPRLAPRMPAVSDFPPVAQAEMNARRVAPQPPVEEEPRGPMGLLKRLTHGLSRREEEQPAARLEPAQHREPAMRPAEPRRPMQQESSIYAPRRGQLDDQGRPQPRAAAPQEDDQLEIPAFLRRQSN